MDKLRGVFFFFFFKSSGLYTMMTQWGVAQYKKYFFFENFHFFFKFGIFKIFETRLPKSPSEFWHFPNFLKKFELFVKIRKMSKSKKTFQKSSSKDFENTKFKKMKNFKRKWNIQKREKLKKNWEISIFWGFFSKIRTRVNFSILIGQYIFFLLTCDRFKYVRRQHS